MPKKSNDNGGQPSDTQVVVSKVLFTVILRGGNFICIHSGMEIVDQQNNLTVILRI